MKITNMKIGIFFYTYKLRDQNSVFISLKIRSFPLKSQDIDGLTTFLTVSAVIQPDHYREPSIRINIKVIRDKVNLVGAVCK